MAKKVTASTAMETRKKKLVDQIIKDQKIIKKNISSAEDTLTDKEKKKIFAPQVRESNNLLITLIKNWLEKLQIPEKELSKRFDSVSNWNNYKRALIIRDSITIECFDNWMNILGLEWKIDIKVKPKNKTSL